MSFKFFIPNYDDSFINKDIPKNKFNFFDNNETNNFRRLHSFNLENELKIQSFDNPNNDSRGHLSHNPIDDDQRLQISENKIKDLNKQLIEEKNYNILLEDKIINYKNYITQLKQMNKKLNKKYENDIKNYVDKIEEMKNINLKLCKKNEKLKEQINQLQQQINSQNNVTNLTVNNNSNNSDEIIRLFKKIEDLNEKINRYPFILEKDETMLSIIFMSVSQKVNYSMICKNTDTINKLESELYKEYPELSETENYFLCKGTIMNKFIKFKEFNIKNGDVIILNQKKD